MCLVSLSPHTSTYTDCLAQIQCGILEYSLSHLVYKAVLRFLYLKETSSLYKIDINTTWVFFWARWQDRWNLISFKKQYKYLGFIALFQPTA